MRYSKLQVLVVRHIWRRYKQSLRNFLCYSNSRVPFLCDHLLQHTQKLWESFKRWRGIYGSLRTSIIKSKFFKNWIERNPLSLHKLITETFPNLSDIVLAKQTRIQYICINVLGTKHDYSSELHSSFKIATHQPTRTNKRGFCFTHLLPSINLHWLPCWFRYKRICWL